MPQLPIHPALIIVSGLPRSGTSLMMGMLEAGGVEVVSDAIRRPDRDNPRGYYEFERVKKLPEGDTAWLEDAQGKAVKIISQLILSLPDRYSYQVLFMRRAIGEILASQQRMLERRGEDAGRVDDGQMARLFDKHLQRVYAWMEAHPNVAYLDVDYNQLLQDPHPHLERVVEFLGRDLDLERMAAVIDPALYRQRR